MDLEAERNKVKGFLAGKAGVEIETGRIPVRTGIDTTEVKKEWPKKIEEEQKETPIQRIEQYRRSIKEQ